MISSPTVLLLGGGYSLKEVARILEPGSFLISSRSDDKLKYFADQGWLGVKLDNQSEEALEKIKNKYPSISVVVDGSPPAHEASDPIIGVKNTAEVFLSNTKRSLIYLSTTGVYGVTDGSWVNESSSLSPITNSGQQRLNSELEYQTKTKNLSILRLPAIYGPGRELKNSFEKGRYFIIDDGKRWSNRIHVSDLANIIVKTISKHLEGQMLGVVCVCDDEPMQQIEVVDLICSKYKIEKPAQISYEEAKSRGLSTMLGNQRVSNVHMKNMLALTLKVPGLRDSLI